MKLLRFFSPLLIGLVGVCNLAQAAWQNIDDRVRITHTAATFDRTSKSYQVRVKFKNKEDTTLEGPFRLLVDNPSLPLLHKDGEDENGVAYVTLADQKLLANQQSELILRFAIKRQPLTMDLRLQQKVSDWELVWQDEFNADNIDESKWGFEVNCWGGGNNEQQCYTDRPENAFLENGVLNIVARKETFTGPAEPEGDISNTATLPYTSARLRTKHKADWRYGRFEIRAKLPHGQGTWPAIWMLPTDYVYGTWAASGEIDIMEAVNLKTQSDRADALPGDLEDRVHGTLHYGRTWPGNVHSGADYRLPNGVNPADGFHVYAIEWEEGEIRWYVDGVHYATQQEAGWYSQYLDESGKMVNGEGSAPFNERFHMLLNLAVGGSWASNVNEKGIDESIFPQRLQVDYVRVYECAINPNEGTGCATVSPDAELVPGHSAPELPPEGSDIGAGPVFALFTDSLTEGLSYNSYNPEGGISFAEVDEAGRGTVLAMEKTSAAGNLYFEYPPRLDLSHWQEYGQLVFDLKVDNLSEGTSLLVKIDSGWPNVSDLSVPLPPLGEWQEVRLSVAQLLASGNSIVPGAANIADVLNPFVLEPSGPISLKIDNVRYEYSMQGLESAVIFDEYDHPPFALGSFVASGSLDIQQLHSGDSDYGMVKQIAFNTNESVVYFQTQATAAGNALKLDVSGFDFIEFDLKVVEDPRTDRQFVVKMDCGYPCGSGDYPINAPEIGQWQHYQIALADLVNHPGSSLNLANVDTPLVFLPAWGNQQGVVVQIDNVRLSGDGDDSNNPPPTPSTVVVDAELALYEDSTAPHWSLWDCCGNASLEQITDNDPTRGQVVEVNFFGPAPTVSGLQSSVVHDVSPISGGTLEFDLKLVSPPNDAGAQMLIKVEAEGGAHAQFPLSASLEGQAPVVGQWQHYSFSIDTLAAAGLDLTKVKLVMIFPEWARAQGAVYHLDNLRLIP
ncbi:family 16 glycosylhydrolase [Aliiglaciecola sp. CAU 1673]|uniref:glycoside hydrolase family 16 protein n=1 Tax=Aliiglaciecola sp. CAU 1673 TaxID=3032595 RepID=UPI0023DCAF90|nr:glycoside hydrolase family 16 protein [Aliiglaciecola sp. CAU 1673]MDF2178877.1 family 16 glycosylhydrolase [Aliiglaciecola sp. CAU 1673]